MVGGGGDSRFDSHPCEEFPGSGIHVEGAEAGGNDVAGSGLEAVDGGLAFQAAAIDGFLLIGKDGIDADTELPGDFVDRTGDGGLALEIATSDVGPGNTDPSELALWAFGLEHPCG